MSLKRIPVDSATDAQLVEYLTVMHGADLAPSKRTGRSLRLELKTLAGEVTHIVVGEQASAPTAPSPAVGSSALQEFLTFAGRPDLTEEERAARDAQRITVILDRSDEPGGDEPIPVCVNGRNMFIPRGEPADIRYPYYAALRNAQRHVVEQTKIGEPPRERTVLAYPFQTIGLAP